MCIAEENKSVLGLTVQWMHTDTLWPIPLKPTPRLDTTRRTKDSGPRLGNRPQQSPPTVMSQYYSLTDPRNEP